MKRILWLIVGVNLCSVVIMAPWRIALLAVVASSVLNIALLAGYIDLGD